MTGSLAQPVPVEEAPKNCNVNSQLLH